MASTGDHGTGRHEGRGTSPAVYRRRRVAVAVLALVVIVALGIVIAVIAGLLGRAGNASGAAAPSSTAPSSAPSASPSVTSTTTPPASATASPTTTPSATATPSVTATPPSTPSATGRPDGTCAASDVVVEAATDQETYTPGALPVLSLLVRNEGEQDCTVNVGTSQMEFVLTLDDEQVFSSAHCQRESADLEQDIAPGSEERATFEWNRNRTVPGCEAVEGDPAPGTYTLTTRLGGRSSEPVTFTLE